MFCFKRLTLVIGIILRFGNNYQEVLDSFYVVLDEILAFSLLKEFNQLLSFCWEVCRRDPCLGWHIGPVTSKTPFKIWDFTTLDYVWPAWRKWPNKKMLVSSKNLGLSSENAFKWKDKPEHQSRSRSVNLGPCFTNHLVISIRILGKSFILPRATVSHSKMRELIYYY